MMKRLLTLTILLSSLFASNSTFSQAKKVWLYNADNYYEKMDFASALRYYHMVLDDTMALTMKILPYEAVLSNQRLKNIHGKKDSVTANISVADYLHHQMGMSYRYSHDYDNAIKYLSLSAEGGSFNDDYYYLGRMLMHKGEYDSALQVFEHYMSLENTSDDIVEKALGDMSGANEALKTDTSDVQINVKLADTTVFNRGSASFATTFWNNDEEPRVVFTSARDGGIVLDPLIQDSEYLCDLYYTEKTADGWSAPKNFGRPLNSARHDASGMFNKGNIIYYTRWSDENKREKHIYLARMVGTKFFESMQLDSAVNLPGYQSINPFVTEDNKWLYFSSNRPGTMGGMDIWKIKLDEQGNPMGEPENLRQPVNSEFDEVSPFFHDVSKNLFFSSDGHKSMGGLDIFRSRWSEDVGSFFPPQNMGKPINSPNDENYFILDEDLENGFVTSNRADCTDCDSLYSLCSYCYKIYEIDLPALEFRIEGYVYDIATNEVIPGAKVEFKDVSYQWEHFDIITDENGYYKHDLIPNLQLFMRASAEDYFADKAVVFTEGEIESRIYQQDFYLEKIPQGEITIEGIEYDFDKATLRPISIEILDRLIEFLELNHNLKIEIRSHTDERGGDDYNQDLSQRRAQSVVDYLIENGIPMERLVPKGYGETMPAEVPDTEGNLVILTPEYIYSLPDKDLQKEYHQRNRRTAFFVLDQNQE